ncbi:MAG: ribosome maturation factor RimP [Deltaproteobacteria bacterium]|nr:ribosome maturation factor RimP [Deltaproteobacteria bacterium]MCL5792996.1 ribosome maturation factor RimP [Deltaproteobacteria bacterium]
MDKYKNIAEDVFKIASENLIKAGYEVIDVEYQREKSGNVLRVFIDKKGIVNADDCAKASNILSSLIDVYVPIHFAYTLEVSSPGLTRELKKESEYIKFAGRDIRVITRKPVNDMVVIEGTLRGITNGDIIVDVNGIELKVPYGIVKKANLTFKI